MLMSYFNSLLCPIGSSLLNVALKSVYCILAFPLYRDRTLLIIKLNQYKFSPIMNIPQNEYT